MRSYNRFYVAQLGETETLALGMYVPLRESLRGYLWGSFGRWSQSFRLLS